MELGPRWFLSPQEGLYFQNLVSDDIMVSNIFEEHLTRCESRSETASRNDTVSTLRQVQMTYRDAMNSASIDGGLPTAFTDRRKRSLHWLQYSSKSLVDSLPNWVSDVVLKMTMTFIEPLAFLQAETMAFSYPGYSVCLCQIYS